MVLKAPVLPCIGGDSHSYEIKVKSKVVSVCSKCGHTLPFDVFNVDSKSFSDKAINNVSEITKATKFGCFHCCRVGFVSDAIKEIETCDEGKTVLCPFCQIDAVVPDTDPENPLSVELLHAVHDQLFKITN